MKSPENKELVSPGVSPELFDDMRKAVDDPEMIPKLIRGEKDIMSKAMVKQKKITGTNKHSSWVAKVAEAIENKEGEKDKN